MPRKTEREDPLGFFNIHFVAKIEKKLKGDPFVKKNSKKVAECQKNLKGDPLVTSGIVGYAGNLFGSVPWANRYNLASSQNFVERLVELFWSLQVYRKNTYEKL